MSSLFGQEPGSKCRIRKPYSTVRTNVGTTCAPRVARGTTLIFVGLSGSHACLRSWRWLSTELVLTPEVHSSRGDVMVWLPSVWLPSRRDVLVSVKCHATVTHATDRTSYSPLGAFTSQQLWNPYSESLA